MSPTHCRDSQIPIVNISPSNHSAANELLLAATTQGFVFIENTPDIGIPPSAISQLFDLSRKFFASLREVKEAVAINSNQAGGNYGWLARGVEMLDPASQKRADVKEALNIGEHHSGHLRQPLPSTLQSHKESLTTFQDLCHAFCLNVLAQLAIALEIEDKTWFHRRHDRTQGPSGTVLRLLYYPQILDAEDGINVRAGAHSDFGSLTLLFQEPGGQPGLEIRDQEGRWVGVPVDPHDDDSATGAYSPDIKANGDAPRVLPILVNIGDLLEDWTGGLLISTVHRVVFPKANGAEEAQGDRYSIAYFLHPLDDARLEAIPSPKILEYVAKNGGSGARSGHKQGEVDGNGKVMTAKEHLANRLRATYSIK